MQSLSVTLSLLSSASLPLSLCPLFKQSIYDITHLPSPHLGPLSSFNIEKTLLSMPLLYGKSFWWVVFFWGPRKGCSMTSTGTLYDCEWEPHNISIQLWHVHHWVWRRILFLCICDFISNFNWTELYKFTVRYYLCASEQMSSLTNRSLVYYS